MKKVVLLLLALSVFSVAKPAKTQPKPSAEKKAKIEVEVKDETPAAEANAVAPETPASDSKPLEQNESLKDSTFALYIHPFNFMVPYWKLMEKISLISTPHYVRVDRTEDDNDGYTIYDIGLQESFRLYGVGGKRWRYFQAGLLVNHLHIHSNRDGSFDGWLYGFMCSGGFKKVLNNGEGFLGRFAFFVDVGLGYAWTSDFDAERKGKYFEMDKGLVIDVNAAFGFQI